MSINWSKVSQSIATVAPWLAGTLGSPVAGVAVKAIVDVFGLAGKNPTPEAVLTAINGASPEQLKALRDAEIQHEQFMQEIGYKHIEQLASAEVADRDSARKRETEVRDHTPKVLAALSVAVFGLIVWYVATGRSPEPTMRDGFWMLVGAIIATYKDVYGYYFGSSFGSKLKDKTIQDMQK